MVCVDVYAALHCPVKVLGEIGKTTWETVCLSVCVYLGREGGVCWALFWVGPSYTVSDLGFNQKIIILFWPSF